MEVSMTQFFILKRAHNADDKVKELITLKCRAIKTKKILMSRLKCVLQSYCLSILFLPFVFFYFLTIKRFKKTNFFSVTILTIQNMSALCLRKW